MGENYFLARARVLQGRVAARWGRVQGGWYELPDAGPPEPFLPGVWLACCGAWQAVTTLPHVCATCGQRYLAPAAGERAG